MRVEEHQGRSLAYLTVTPDGDRIDQPYPAVILLHGFGANMADLAGLCPAIDEKRYTYVCPNAPLPVNGGLGNVGYAWTPPGGGPSSEFAQKAEAQLDILFQELQDEGTLEPGRVILGGFSQGGAMTYRWGLKHPERFRGLAALSGSFRDAHELEGRLPVDAGQSIFIAHGTADRMIGVEAARESRDFLESLGYRPVYHEYDMGHEISQEVIDDLKPWIRGLFSSSTAPIQSERRPPSG